MFTKDNLHHARIEDIVSDLLSRIETLESNRQEIQSTMQNDTIIKALSEKIERLEAENANLKTPPIEKALNTVFGINPDSIVDFSPKDLSLSNHYILLSIEGLNESKAENDRQFEWNQENLKKIEELEKENQLITEERNDLLLHQLANTPKIVSQWKNGVKDGLPTLYVGCLIVINWLWTSSPEYMIQFVEIENEAQAIEFRSRFISDTVGFNFDYFIIPRQK